MFPLITLSILTLDLLGQVVLGKDGLLRIDIGQMVYSVDLGVDL